MQRVMYHMPNVQRAFFTVEEMAAHYELPPWRIREMIRLKLVWKRAV